MQRAPSIRLSLLIFLVFAAIGVAATPAGANPAFLCPPLPVSFDEAEERGDVCVCKFFNYDRVSTSVSIQIYSELDGQVAECPDVSVPPKRGTECSYTFMQEDNCACSVQVPNFRARIRGRASINVLNPFDGPRTWDGRACN